MPVTPGESHCSKCSWWGPRASGRCNPLHCLQIDEGQSRRGLSCVCYVVIIKPSREQAADSNYPINKCDVRKGAQTHSLRMYSFNFLTMGEAFSAFKYHEHTKQL